MPNSSFPHGKVALVTGASSGIGRETALLFAMNGYTVYGASRRGTLPELPAGAPGVLHAVSMDVTDEASVRQGVETICAAEGRVDVLVHAAGNGLSGPAECCTAQDAQRQMDVNYYGALRLLNAILPGMRARRQGIVLLVGSVGGIFAIPFQTLYSSSKAALAMLSDGLRLELRPYGVHAALIEPGDVKTGFTDARKPVANACNSYHESYERAISRMVRDEENGMHPRSVAAAILRAAQKKNPKAHSVVGGAYRAFVFLKRILPVRLTEALLYKMYLG